MKRIEKQITGQNEIISILENNKICRIAFSENNIYLHSAKEGKR